MQSRVRPDPSGDSGGERPPTQHPAGGAQAELLHLQMAAGNRAVVGLLAGSSNVIARRGVRTQRPPTRAPERLGGKSGPAPFESKADARERERIRTAGEERLWPVLEGGGFAPFFVSIDPVETVSQSPAGSVRYAKRRFHVLSALRYHVEKAANDAEVELVGWVYAEIVPSERALQALKAGKAKLPPLPITWKELREIDPGANSRKAAYEKARRKRRKPECTAGWIPRAGGSTMHNRYAEYVATHYGNPTLATVEYEIHTKRGRVTFDHYHPTTNLFVEAKTRHQPLLREWDENWHFIVERLYEQAERQREALVRCEPNGRLVWAFDDPHVAQVARMHFADIADEVWAIPWKKRT